MEPIASSELASGSNVTSSLGTSDEYTIVLACRGGKGKGRDGTIPNRRGWHDTGSLGVADRGQQFGCVSCPTLCAHGGKFGVVLYAIREQLDFCLVPMEWETCITRR
jgi:hypothetical protein